MSYTIQYNPENSKRYPMKPAYKKRNWLVITGVLVLVFVIGWIGMKERNVLKEFFLPGDPEITEEALSTMAENIRDGVNMSDAITAFCQEIIENANVQN